MSVTIDRNGADAYFGAANHVQAALWAAFDDTRKTAAITHAQRLVTRALGSAIESETDDSTRSYYPAYAVYEQALHMLLHSNAVSNSEETAPHYAGTDGEGRAQEPARMCGLCAEALQWLDWQSGPTVRIVRG